MTYHQEDNILKLFYARYCSKSYEMRKDHLFNSIQLKL